MIKIKLLSVLCLLFFFAGHGIEENGYQVGDTVRDFNLKGVSGEMVSLSDYKNARGIILIFDCNTCPVSQAYNNRIIDLHKKYADKGYPVVAINPNDAGRQPGDSFEEMVKYAKKRNYQHAYLQDADQSVAKAFGATNTPHVYVLKKIDNAYQVAYIGAIDNNSRDADAADKKYVEDAVNTLLKGKEPATTKTKAIGCGIKWKSA